MKPEHVAASRGERGIALVMALMVLLALSMLSVLLMMSLTVETKIAGFSARQAQAMNAAEAGVAEALSRIRNFDIPNSGNPRQVAQIFLAAPGSVPVLGADSVALATGQTAGGWMDYSTANKDSDDVLTVTYKTESTRIGAGWIPGPPTLIYKYDPALSPPIQPNTGYPIFVVTSTGRKANQYRRIETEVIQRPFNTRMEAAVAAKYGIEFSGNARVCGYNHRMDTPAYTQGVHSDGFCDPWETNTGDLPGAWSEGAINSGGAAKQKGSPVPNKGGQVGLFYAGPWEALGLTQAEFFSWVGSPQLLAPIPPIGVVYLDNNAATQDQSGIYAYHGGNGEGLLYVDGDLAINGNFTFRGLIYVEGDLQINGNSWILGGLVVKGKTTIKIANGDLDVLFSRDAVTQNLAKYGGQFMTLAWREIVRQ